LLIFDGIVMPGGAAAAAAGASSSTATATAGAAAAAAAARDVQRTLASLALQAQRRIVPCCRHLDEDDDDDDDDDDDERRLQRDDHHVHVHRRRRHHEHKQRHRRFADDADEAKAVKKKRWHLHNNNVMLRRFPLRCALHVARGFFRGWCIGVATKAALELLLALLSKELSRHPLRVLQRALFQKSTQRFARFACLLVGLQRAVTCALSNGVAPRRARWTWIGGTVSALCASAWLGNQSKSGGGLSSTLVLHLFVRSLYDLVLVRQASSDNNDSSSSSSSGSIMSSSSRWLPLFTFALSHVPLAYAFMFLPSAVPSYTSFMLRAAHLKPYHISAMRKAPFVACSEQHHTDSCVRYNLIDWSRAFFRRALPLYAPVHILPMVFSAPKQLLMSPLRSAWTLVLHIGRSSLFLSCFSALLKSALCAYRNSRRVPATLRRLLPGVAGLLMGFTLFFERPERHLELALYAVPHAVQALLAFARLAWPRPARWLAHRTSHWPVSLLFSLSIGTLLYCSSSRSGAASLQPINASALRTVFGRSSCVVMTSEHSKSA
jgi:hypothetical protein